MKSILDFREIGVFNSREVVIFFCGCTVLLVSLFKKNLRDSIFRVVKAFFAKNLLILYFSAILYSSLLIYIFYLLDFWTVSITKDVVFWLMFSAFPVLMSVKNAENDKKFFKKILKESIQLTVIADFITGQHTFNIFVEFILLIFTLFIGGIIAYSSKEEKHKDIHKIFSVIASISGIYILMNSVYYFIKDINSFMNIQKLEEFSIPIFLEIWFIPFLYATYVYITYENVFLSMQFAIENKTVLKYAKKVSIFKFNLNLDLLRRWRSNLLLQPVQSREGVLISILDVKRLILIEKNPPKIDFSKGWSPYESKDFLNEKGIFTNYYKNVYDDEWQAISPYINLDNEILGNNIAYYVVGNSSTAKELSLSLKINFLSDQNSAISTFLENVQLLHSKALNEELPLSLTTCIRKGQNKVVTVSGKKVSVKREDYVGNLKGYALRFTIEHR